MAPQHSLNQCWHVVNFTIRNTSQSNFNRNSYIFKKMHFKMSSGKWRPFCLVHNVLRYPWWCLMNWVVEYSGSDHNTDWKMRVVMMPTLLQSWHHYNSQFSVRAHSLIAVWWCTYATLHMVLIGGSSYANFVDKVGIITTLSFQWEPIHLLLCGHAYMQPCTALV